MSQLDPLFAVTAPGLERIAADELQGLDIAAAAVPGGVAWTGNAASLFRANLHLRTATRILLRIGEFRARTFFELERHARRLPWNRFLSNDRTAILRVTCHKSRLYHQAAVAERFLDAIGHATGAAASVTDSDEPTGTAQLVVVRFVRDVCTVSMDTSGDPLYRRGYRQALAKAPLRETLATAMILAAAWDPRSPFLDPLCGSGTIAIEAALLARRVPPGLARQSREPRDFAFLHWPDFAATDWQRAVDDARVRILHTPGAPILASDRNAGAIRAARANARRAGVGDDIEFSICDLDNVQPPEHACIVTNPPYGRRAGTAHEIRAIQHRFQNFAASSSLTLATLVPEDWPSLAGVVAAFHTRNGGIPVRLDVRGPRAPLVPAGRGSGPDTLTT